MKLYLLIIIVGQFSLLTAQECNPYGFYCESCSVAVLCVDDLPTNSSIICPPGNVCNENSEYECDPTAPCETTVTTTEDPSLCLTPGRYPDPTSCSKYFTCVTDPTAGGIIKYEYSCPGNSLFDPNVEKCTANYDCSRASDIEAVASSVGDSTAATSSESSSTTEETTEPSTTPGDFVCPSTGVFENPESCTSYYRCSVNLVSFLYTCPSSTTFNENLMICSTTPSARCATGTTASTPTTTSSTTPATTSSTTPPTTSSTTPATTSTSTTVSTTTPGPFVCPSSGVFMNPSSCTTYYRCTTSLVAWLYTCPSTTTFNEALKTCSTTPSAKCKAQGKLKEPKCPDEISDTEDFYISGEDEDRQMPISNHNNFKNMLEKKLYKLFKKVLEVSDKKMKVKKLREFKDDESSERYEPQKHIETLKDFEGRKTLHHHQ